MKEQRNKGKRDEFWTPTLDTWLIELWPLKRLRDVSKTMQIGEDRIRRRAVHLGLPLTKCGCRYEPPVGLWIAIASEEAAAEGVLPYLVLGGGMSERVCRARWKAWRRILDENPEVSIAGVGRVSGFDYSTILHGLKRIGGASPVDLRDGFVNRASGRVPLPPTGGG